MGQTARIIRATNLNSLAAAGVAVLAAFLLASPAAAKTCTKRVAPPGHAGSTQYFETVPTSCGNAPPPSGSSTSGGPINHLGQGKAGLHALSRLGSNGKAAASLAAATAPTSAPPSGATTPSSGSVSKPSGGRGSGKSLGSGQGALSGSGQGTPSGSGLPWTGGSTSGALGNALTGSDGGLGILLPILMGLALIAAIALGLIRARRPGGPSI